MFNSSDQSHSQMLSENQKKYSQKLYYISTIFWPHVVKIRRSSRIVSRMTVTEQWGWTRWPHWTLFQPYPFCKHTNTKSDFATTCGYCLLPSSQYHITQHYYVHLLLEIFWRWKKPKTLLTKSTSAVSLIPYVKMILIMKNQAIQTAYVNVIWPLVWTQHSPWLLDHRCLTHGMDTCLIPCITLYLPQECNIVRK